MIPRIREIVRAILTWELARPAVTRDNDDCYDGLRAHNPVGELTSGHAGHDGKHLGEITRLRNCAGRILFATDATRRD